MDNAKKGTDHSKYLMITKGANIMKRKLLVGSLLLTLSMVGVAGCGAAEDTTDTSVEEVQEDAAEEEATEEVEEEADEADEAEDDAEDTELANPWTESDREGVSAATGFDIAAPEGATEVSYSYMEEEGLAQMSYTLDGTAWNYRMEYEDELTDISGMEYDWTSESDGTVADRTAKYYAFCHLDDATIDDVMVVNWYDTVPGVVYSLSATATDLNGLDIQVVAEDIFEPLQGEATADPAADKERELNDYFLGEHTKSYDGSTLTITDNGDDTFKVDLSIVGLCSMEDGVGTYDDHKIFFDITDPSENTMKGMIYLDADNSLCVKITDSTWELLPTDEVIDGFGK